MDSKQANHLLYSREQKEDIFGRMWRKLFPEENKEESQNFFLPLESTDTNVPSFLPYSYYF